jgi:hypothetical protein
MAGFWAGALRTMKESVSAYSRERTEMIIKDKRAFFEIPAWKRPTMPQREFVRLIDKHWGMESMGLVSTRLFRNSTIESADLQ